jgi:GH18 family chitinase
MTAVITKAKANGAKVMLAIANPGSGNNFKTMASTAAGRNTFVKDVMTKMRQYGFDGADIDWEFPSVADGTDITFTALMKELSDSLHRDAKYYLSAALVAGKYIGNLTDAIKPEVFGYADFFNIMAYDDFSTTTPYRHHSDYNLAVVCLNYWLNTRGMPKEKCVLGIPAYGRASGITQSGTTMSYRSILGQGGNPLLDSAIVSQGSFTNYTIYYNGQKTVKDKAMLAKQRANGVMFWEKWQDTNDATSLLRAACDTIGRPY